MSFLAIVRLAVDLAVGAPVNLAGPMAPLVVGDARLRLGGLGVEDGDLVCRAAVAEIDPAGVVGGDRTGIFVPVLRINVAVISELTRLGVETDEAATRIAGRPEAPLVVLGH